MLKFFILLLSIAFAVSAFSGTGSLTDGVKSPSNVKRSASSITSFAN